MNAYEYEMGYYDSDDLHELIFGGGPLQYIPKGLVLPTYAPFLPNVLIHLIEDYIFDSMITFGHQTRKKAKEYTKWRGRLSFGVWHIPCHDEICNKIRIPTIRVSTLFATSQSICLQSNSIHVKSIDPSNRSTTFLLSDFAKLESTNVFIPKRVYPMLSQWIRNTWNAKNTKTKEKWLVVKCNKSLYSKLILFKFTYEIYQ